MLEDSRDPTEVRLARAQSPLLPPPPALPELRGTFTPLPLPLPSEPPEPSRPLLLPPPSPAASLPGPAPTPPLCVPCCRIAASL